MKPLTQRQTQTLRFITEFIDKHGIPPTRTDLAIELDVTRKAAHVLIHTLAKKGHIEILAGSSRGIRLINNSEEEAPPTHALPLIGRVAAGPPVLATDEVDEWIRVDPGLFHPRPDYLRKVSGSSMIDMGIQDGDLIAIRSQPTADNGQVIVAKLFLGAEPEITVKKYRQRGNKVELIPRNSAMETIVIDLREETFEIEGLYCGHIHLNKNRR
jgi:repressor LexA